MGSKIDVYEANDAGKKIELSDSVNETVIFEASAPAGFDNLMIIDGPNTPTPSGYIKFNTDLNRGAGGAYLYLCIKRSTPGQITDLSLQDTGSSGRPTAPTGYKLVRDQDDKVVDLNRGAGGSFIWLSHKSEPSQNVITRIGLLAANSRRPDTPNGWTRMTVELNEGAGGWWIYLMYKKG